MSLQELGFARWFVKGFIVTLASIIIGGILFVALLGGAWITGLGYATGSFGAWGKFFVASYETGVVLVPALIVYAFLIGFVVEHAGGMWIEAGEPKEAFRSSIIRIPVQGIILLVAMFILVILMNPIYQSLGDLSLIIILTVLLPIYGWITEKTYTILRE